MQPSHLTPGRRLAKLMGSSTSRSQSQNPFLFPHCLACCQLGFPLCARCRNRSWIRGKVTRWLRKYLHEPKNEMKRRHVETRRKRRAESREQREREREGREAVRCKCRTHCACVCTEFCRALCTVCVQVSCPNIDGSDAEVRGLKLSSRRGQFRSR